MSEIQDHGKLKVLPLQVAEVTGGVVLKRGRHEIRVTGGRAVEAVRAVLAAAADGQNSAGEIADRFAATERAEVSHLLNELRERRFIVDVEETLKVPPGPESASDIFYWHFGFGTADVAARVKGRIVILGLNVISRQIAGALREAGFEDVEVVHYPLLCNFRLTGADGQADPREWPDRLAAPVDYSAWRDSFDPASLACLVATSDFGGANLMRPWNEFCVRGGHPFLPVVLQDLIGYVGPIVMPGETACYECLRARQNANLPAPELSRRMEEQAFAAQTTTGFHPSMASILGDLAALELTRLHARLGPPRLVGSMLEVNLMAPSIAVRKVLKLPGCSVCGPRSRSPASPLRNVFLPGNEWQE